MRQTIPRRRGEEKARFNTLLPKWLDENMRAFSDETGEELTSIAIRGIEAAISGNTAGSDSDSISLPILQDVPCGPFEEAISDNPSRLVFNGDWKRELGVFDDDLLIYAHGQSMEGAHITDGALLVIERLPAYRRAPEGKPALIQIHYDGKAECTVKNYHTKNGKPLLRDGDGKEVKLPAHVEKLDVIGVVKRAILEF